MLTLQSLFRSTNFFHSKKKIKKKKYIHYTDLVAIFKWMQTETKRFCTCMVNFVRLRAKASNIREREKIINSNWYSQHHHPSQARVQSGNFEKADDAISHTSVDLITTIGKRILHSSSIPHIININFSSFKCSFAHLTGRLFCVEQCARRRVRPQDYRPVRRQNVYSNVTALFDHHQDTETSLPDRLVSSPASFQVRQIQTINAFYFCRLILKTIFTDKNIC